MGKPTLTKALMVTGIVLALIANAGAQMALDLDSNDGDQGVRTAKVMPGSDVKVQLVSTGPVKGLVGIEIDLEFDGSQVKFGGFKPGGLLKGATSMPPSTMANGARVSVALMGGEGDSDGSATLGEFTFKVTSGLGRETAIKLTSISMGTSAGTKKLQVDEAVTLVNEGAAKTAEKSSSQPPGPTR